MTPVALVVMGVSGVGKSTIGAAVAHELGWPFIEGDELHSSNNIAKLTAGEPLTCKVEPSWWRSDWLSDRDISCIRVAGNAVRDPRALKRRRTGRGFQR